MWYAKTAKAIPQVLADIGLVLVAAIMAGVARQVNKAIGWFATPTQATADAATTFSQSLSHASSEVGNVPLVGSQLAQSFENMAGGVSGLATGLGKFVVFIHATALVVAIVVFLLPVVLYLLKWLPWRLSFVRESRAGNKLLFAESAIEMMSLRAIANAPLSELAKISKDPMGAWKNGDQAVMTALANLELARDGLKLPGRANAKKPWARLGRRRNRPSAR